MTSHRTTHRRTTRRRRAATATGIAALLAGLFGLTQADAISLGTAEDGQPRTLSSQEAGELAATLTQTLSGDAGAYYDADSRTLVVNVLDASGVPDVEAAGAEARVVDNSLAELADAEREVEDFAVPGTAWAVDPVSNAVTVTVDDTVTGDDLAAVQDGVAALGDRASLAQAEGEFQPSIAGGDAIYTSAARCSLGFNVTTAEGTPGFLTAGHCAETGTSWSDSQGTGATGPGGGSGGSGGSGGPGGRGIGSGERESGVTSEGEIGVTTDSVFPDSDYALVEYTADVDHPSAVDLYDGTTQEITAAGEAFVGQEVQRSGSTSGVHSGTVTAVDVAVRYEEGTVYGTIQTDVCAEAGDSGGPLFSGDTALGITSGGSGNCTRGGTTFYYPVTDALAATGATIP